MFHFYLTLCDTMDIRIQRISRDLDGFFLNLGYKFKLKLKNPSESREIR
jgi:hypothetical protein